MGRRIRSLPGVDRTEFDGKPVGLQRPGDHHFDRRLFVVHLFHSTENSLKRIRNTVGSADTGRPEWPAGSHSFGHDRTSPRPVLSPSPLARLRHCDRRYCDAGTRNSPAAIERSSTDTNIAVNIRDPMALLRHRTVPLGIPLSAPKRTWGGHTPKTGFDPEPTSLGQQSRVLAPASRNARHQDAFSSTQAVSAKFGSVIFLE